MREVKFEKQQKEWKEKRGEPSPALKQAQPWPSFSRQPHWRPAGPWCYASRPAGTEVACLLFSTAKSGGHQ